MDEIVEKSHQQFMTISTFSVWKHSLILIVFSSALQRQSTGTL
jgi:hypothetical protein